ncbi:MAG: hypothetical protein QXE23_08790 [Nitrososphaerota archaeon]
MVKSKYEKLRDWLEEECPEGDIECLHDQWKNIEAFRATSPKATPGGTERLFDATVRQIAEIWGREWRRTMERWAEENPVQAEIWGYRPYMSEIIEVIPLAYVREMSVAEIAAATGYSSHSVWNTLWLARKIGIEIPPWRW